MPHVVGASCRPEFDRVRFEHGRHADAAFRAWCEGRTGYPLVDAAMAQIEQTGWMHNRLRMLTASFLHQGSRHRLAARRGLLRPAPDRLRACLEQRRLAVGGVDRLRCAALVPHLQPADPESTASTPRASSSAATCRSSRASTTSRSMRRGWSARSSSRPPASSSAATTRDRSSTTPRRAQKTLQRYAVVRAAKDASLASASRPRRTERSLAALACQASVRSAAM